MKRSETILTAVPPNLIICDFDAIFVVSFNFKCEWTLDGMIMLDAWLVMAGQSNIRILWNTKFTFVKQKAEQMNKIISMSMINIFIITLHVWEISINIERCKHLKRVSDMRFIEFCWIKRYKTRLYRIWYRSRKRV